FEVVRNGHALGDAWVDLDSLSEMRREALKALQDIAVDEMASSTLDESMTVSVYEKPGGWSIPLPSACLSGFRFRRGPTKRGTSLGR
ncbi:MULTISPECIES: hypothetical protein, partial [unclassified Mesorhizobium]|uniref:hypothetical protein n=1 Tax=unclassified Mesorhizobium TaxID=325217 RepID=UPI001AEF2637